MIVGKYSIESDALNVTVYEISKVKDKDSKNFGKETKKAIGYFSTMHQAYKFIVDREVRITGLTDLNTVMEKINELFNYIEERVGNE
ncbi:hypothetical protein ABFP60_02075 [Clostridioides difficile]